MYENISPEHLTTLRKQLMASYERAKGFNSDKDQRQRKQQILFRAALNGKKNMPNLIKQETHAIHGALNIIFHTYADDKTVEESSKEYLVQ